MQNRKLDLNQGKNKTHFTLISMTSSREDNIYIIILLTVLPRLQVDLV